MSRDGTLQEEARGARVKSASSHVTALLYCEVRGKCCRCGYEGRRGGTREKAAGEAGVARRRCLWR